MRVMFDNADCGLFKKWQSLSAVPETLLQIQRAVVSKRFNKRRKLWRSHKLQIHNIHPSSTVSAKFW